MPAATLGRYESLAALLAVLPGRLFLTCFGVLHQPRAGCDNDACGDTAVGCRHLTCTTSRFSGVFLHGLLVSGHLGPELGTCIPPGTGAYWISAVLLELRFEGVGGQGQAEGQQQPTPDPAASVLFHQGNK
jgi:hypothetical protein